MRFFTRSCGALLLVASLMLGGTSLARAQSQPQPQPQPQSQPQTQPQSPAEAQVERQQSQPLNNAPVWREVRKDGQEHYTSVQGRETGVLIQSGGETWRQLRNGPITFYGGLLIVLAAVLIGGFYLWRGTIRLHEPMTGRLIQRFTLVERCAHWSMAISFCVLGISGMVILFGKHILLPVIGHTLFAWITALMKNLHNFIGPLFMLSIVLFVIIYIRHNFPSKGDLQWILNAGGLINGKHIPAGRFNAGEKGWFWVGVICLGTLMSVSGVVLLFPNFDQVRATMQLANVVHGVAAALFIAMSLAHIYIGTLGMEGAFQGMRTGYVDESWLKEHHEYTYNEVMAAKGNMASTAHVANAGTDKA
jgi:formate dehydrogenase subunit gamma